MRRRTMLWALVALNALLLVVLTWKLGGDNPAQAQARGGRGDYIMVPGRVNTAPNGVMYIVDTRNGLIGGMTFDPNARGLITLPPISLGRVFEAAAPPVPPPPAGRTPRR